MDTYDAKTMIPIKESSVSDKEDQSQRKIYITVNTKEKTL